MATWLKQYDTPRSLSSHSLGLSAGSDQRRSFKRPKSGTSVGLLIIFISSIEFSTGDKPPWTQNIREATDAAIGSVLNVSMKIFHVFKLALLLHSS
ncbi:hypothetical protein OGAPHI_005855 [Ogataea philodendri]|uniref:Uncharacterized protein n=1 Tax=Ogataea philodendri TaxID=1378263 RepID=A0A9P8NYK8_9ASCO|nr:uncharacterized protein OGAPHI_005855 [Ogataea philodendri]KAH3662603.1 hypothetical protein OGAPHI_005855 [Ogataea philodendri]